MASDPFNDRNALDANPFADPSVRNALSSSGRAYDEYDSKSFVTGDEDDIAGSARPATNTLGRGDGGFNEGGSASNSRLEDIQRRERELEQRERELQTRADHIQKHGRNNWPFFFPLIYHDISTEIPAGDLQVAMTHIYYLWLILVATLIINLVACVFIGVKEVISAIVYLVVITPASFMLWYRPIYNGFMKEHALFYYVYFIFCGFHLAWSIYVFLGIPETGSAALLTTIESFTSENKRLVAGILGIIVTVGFSLQGLGNLWYFKQIWKHNHEQGHSFAQARSELASHGAKAYFTRGSNV